MAVNSSTIENDETVLVSPYISATAEDYAAIHRRRARRLVGWSFLVTLILGAIYLLADGNVIVPLAVLTVVALMALMIQYPTVIMPITLAGTCLFEQNYMMFKDSVTDRVPLFWDVNTIVQIYGHQNFHAMPFSLFEILFLMSAISWLIRGIYERSLTFTWGSLALPIIGYVVCVGYGIAYGIATGGDYHIALFEARPQFYLLLAYLLSVNSGMRAQNLLRTMLWISALCIGLKGLMETFRFFVTLGGHTQPDIGVGSHEESFFFNSFMMLLAILWMAGIEKKLSKVMFCLLPFVLIADLANERRAATAALMLAVPLVLILAAVAFSNRRKLVLGVFIVLALISAVYFPAYWNKNGVLAQPARALKSQFSPDPRDQSSDVYRQAEDGNLMFTMRTSPIYGYGYGKRIMLYYPMVDLSDKDPLILYRTHDQILWVWMRLGSIGFFFFWVMIAAILMKAAQTIRWPVRGQVIDVKFDRQKMAVAVYVAALTVMLLMFGLYDMQLSSARDMLYFGFWVGLLAAFLAQEAKANAPAPISGPYGRTRSSMQPAPNLGPVEAPKALTTPATGGRR